MKQPQLLNNPNYILNPHLSDIVWPEKGAEIGLDTETFGNAAWRDKCRIVTLHLEDTTYLLQPEFYTREELHQLVATMLDYLVVAHGAKFDIGFMYALSGIWLTNVWCTQVGSQLLGGGRRLWKHTLTHSLSRYLKIELGEDKKEMQKSFLVDGPLTDEQLAYAAKDVKYLVQLKKELLFQINNMRLDKVLKLELALIPVLAEMEFEGCLVDVAAWRALLKEWEIKKKEYLGLLDAEVMRIYPMMLFPNINYGSPQQVTRLFKDLGLPVPMKDEGKDKGSRPSTEESVLEMYLNEHPGTPVQKFVELLLQYREYEKLISTYGASFLDRVDSRGHIHTIYGQTSTATHRLSSKEPNLQNIPSKKSGDGVKVRAFFLARPGYKMITSDMEGAEIRLAGDFSGEPVIVDAMINDKDMHSHLASVSFSIICDQPVTITKTKEPLVINGIEIIPEDARDIHKSVTFSKFYKGGPPRVYQVLARYINKFHKAGTRMEIATQISYAIDNALPVLTAYLSRLIKQANIQGYLITTKLGRRRYFDTKVYGEAANAPIQGSNADAMKIAMVRMYRYLKETGYGRLVLTVHDELVVEAKEEHAEEVAKVLQKEMADALGYFLTVIPGKAGVKINDHWEK